MVRLFAAPQGFVTYVFIPGICMELPDSKSPLYQARHCARQIRSATRFHFSSLPCCRLWLCIAIRARGNLFSICTDNVPPVGADWTIVRFIVTSDFSVHQTVTIPRMLGLS